MSRLDHGAAAPEAMRAVAALNRYAASSGEAEQRLYTLSAWRETPFFAAGSARRWHGPKR